MIVQNLCDEQWKAFEATPEADQPRWGRPTIEDRGTM
jgi:hypothetical protein